MNPKELGNADCLKRLIVDCDGIYWRCVCFRKDTVNCLSFLIFSFMLSVVAHWQLSTSCWRVVACIFGTDTTLNIYSCRKQTNKVGTLQKNRWPWQGKTGDQVLYLAAHWHWLIFVRIWRFPGSLLTGDSEKGWHTSRIGCSVHRVSGVNEIKYYGWSCWREVDQAGLNRNLWLFCRHQLLVNNMDQSSSCRGVPNSSELIRDNLWQHDVGKPIKYKVFQHLTEDGRQRDLPKVAFNRLRMRDVSHW